MMQRLFPAIRYKWKKKTWSKKSGFALWFYWEDDNIECYQ